MNNIINILAYTILAILIFPALSTLYDLVISKRLITRPNNKYYDFGIIVTAYKNYDIALNAVDSFIKQNYSKNNYHVYLVADDCLAAKETKSNTVTILIPEKPLASKIKSISYAIDKISYKHEYIIVIDSDNLADPNYLLRMNELVSLGYLAVQGRRTHKNIDTIYASLDAAGEIYYNYTQRTVPFNIGSSAAISGSAMAIEKNIMQSFIKEIMIEEGIIIAEDKMLQNYLLRNNLKIAFAENAIVFDEKISGGYQTQRQRTRWLNSYFQNLKSAASLCVIGVENKSFNQAYFGLMTAYPPIITLLILSSLIVFSSLTFSIEQFVVITIGWLVFALNFLLILKIKKANSKIWESLLYIPLFAFRQIMALLSIRKHKNDFLATEHKKNISLQEVMEGK